MDLSSITKVFMCLCLLLFSLLSWVNAIDINKSTTHVNPELSQTLLYLGSHPRLAKLNPDKFYGAEGSDVPGFLLKKTLALVTPGLMTPASDVTDHPLLTIDLSHLCDHKKLHHSHRSEKVARFLDTLSMKASTRHGQKKGSSFKVFHPAAQDGPCREDSLTTAGLLQMINLGEHLFHCYSSKLHSLKGAIENGADMAETIGDPLLYQSLTALLYGTLTEKQFVLVDVKKLSKDYHSFEGQGKVKNDMFNDMKYYDVTNQDNDKNDMYHGIKYYAEQAFKNERWLLKKSKQENSGSVNELPSKELIRLLLNLVHSGSSQNSLMEDSMLKYILSQLDVDDVFNASGSFNGYLSTSRLFQEFSLLHTNSLRERIVHFLGVHRLDVKDDFRVMAVDDLMMFSLLVSFGLVIDQHQPPASRLVFEVFEQSAQSLVDPPGDLSDASSNSFIDLNFSSHASNPGISTMSSESSEKKNSDRPYVSAPQSLDIPSFANRNNAMYIRVLYNGQIMAPSLAGCHKDSSIVLGLCGAEHFVNVLSSNMDNLHLQKEEL